MTANVHLVAAQGDIDTLTALADDRGTQIDTLTGQLTAAEQRVKDLEGQVATVHGTRLDFGVGIDVLGNVEALAKAPVGFHRTYHTMPSASGVPSSLVRAVEADLAARRTPVVSVKLPGGAADAAGVLVGKYDAGLDAIGAKLDSYGAPVLLALHHEPEGDYALADYVAMTKHALPHLGRAHVQFWQCFEGYPQINPGEKTWTLANAYVPGVAGIGFDPYLSFGASSTKWTDQTATYYKPFGDFAAAQGIQWGIWETGINEQAITSGNPKASTWFADCAAGARAHGATPWCYFGTQSKKDGKHDWRLSTSGANKLAQMAAVVAAYARPAV